MVTIIHLSGAPNIFVGAPTVVDHWLGRGTLVLRGKTGQGENCPGGQMFGEHIHGDKCHNAVLKPIFEIEVSFYYV